MTRHRVGKRVKGSECLKAQPAYSRPGSRRNLGDEMKAYVLLGLRNAELLIGYRIMFLDRENMSNEYGHFGVDIFTCDGWLLEHPELGPFSWYMNHKLVDKEFEVLGEL